MEKKAPHYTFHYRITDQNGRLIEETASDAPMLCEEGKRQVMPAIELALSQMKIGEKKTVCLDASETYGAHDPEKVWITPLSQFENHENLKVGDVFTFQSENESNPVLRVIKIDEKEVTLDGNPPLAGMSLNFEIHLLKVEHGSSNH